MTFKVKLFTVLFKKLFSKTPVWNLVLKEPWKWSFQNEILIYKALYIKYFNKKINLIWKRVSTFRLMLSILLFSLRCVFSLSHSSSYFVLLALSYTFSQSRRVFLVHILSFLSRALSCQQSYAAVQVSIIYLLMIHKHKCNIIAI